MPKDESAVEQRYEIEGLSVTEQDGDGSEPKVVIVHGGMDRASSFGRLARVLDDVPLVRYDRRGYGRSEPVATDLDGHVADLLTVIGNRRVVVFGHSIGGTIALTAAARHPDQVGALLVYESPTPWFTTTRYPASRSLKGLDPADAAESFMVSMVGERTCARLPKATRDARRAEGEALLADFAIVEGDAPFDLTSVRQPVIVAAGTATARFRQEAARELSERLPAGELVEVADADHGIHLSAPKAAATLVRSLRAKVTPG